MNHGWVTEEFRRRYTTEATLPTVTSAVQGMCFSSRVFQRRKHLATLCAGVEGPRPQRSARQLQAFESSTEISTGAAGHDLSRRVEKLNTRRPRSFLFPHLRGIGHARGADAPKPWPERDPMSWPSERIGSLFSGLPHPPSGSAAAGSRGIAPQNAGKLTFDTGRWCIRTKKGWPPSPCGCGRRAED